MLILKGEFVERYMDDYNYEDIENGFIGKSIRILERSHFNTVKEIREYETLNAKQPVKTYKLNTIIK